MTLPLSAPLGTQSCTTNEKKSRLRQSDSHQGYLLFPDQRQQLIVGGMLLSKEKREEKYGGKLQLTVVWES